MKTTVSTIALALASLTLSFAQARAPQTPPAGSKPVVAATAKPSKKHTRKVIKRTGTKHAAGSNVAAKPAAPAPVKQ